MTFNSCEFFLFLPIVYLIFFFTADRWRWLVLLGASYFFYGYLKPYLLAVLLCVTALSYLFALRIKRCTDEHLRRRWFWSGTICCVGVLSLFKYLPLLESQANSLFDLHSNIASRVVLIGVSYFIFQSISYLTDVYLEIQEPETHFGIYSLYMAFFPKLLQGPIERGGDLLPQLNKPYRFDYASLRSGLLLFAYGLFKKVVIADRLAIYADQVYNNVPDHSGFSLLLGTYAYALQIFFDFSGYTDMARGTGRLFGVSLTENFNKPYLATSIADFWRRWHISFSRWILDYIFKPLQMQWRNAGQAGTAAALLVAFFISGLWHGSASGFIAWGGLHGIYLAVSIYYRPYQKRLYRWLGVEKSPYLKWWQAFVTFHLVTFAWIFFRAKSVAEAWEIIRKMVQSTNGMEKLVVLDKNTFLILAYLAALALITVRPQARERFVSLFNGSCRWVFYYLFVMLILTFGVFGHEAFLYGRF